MRTRAPSYDRRSPSPQSVFLAETHALCLLNPRVLVRHPDFSIVGCQGLCQCSVLVLCPQVQMGLRVGIHGAHGIPGNQEEKLGLLVRHMPPTPLVLVR
jgi:hypothetical protein